MTNINARHRKSRQNEKKEGRYPIQKENAKWLSKQLKMSQENVHT